MDDQPRGGDNPLDRAELSGPVHDAVELIRHQEPSSAMLGRVLERARQIGTATQEAVGTAAPRIPPTRRSRMLTYAFRGLAASVAAAALAGAWLHIQVPSTAAADLGSVLTRTAAAESLTLKITSDGKTSDVWIRGRKLRQNLPNGEYQIVRDDQRWLVDEKANRASMKPAAAFLKKTDGVDRVNLLAVAGFSGGGLGDKEKDLLAAAPAEAPHAMARRWNFTAGKRLTSKARCESRPWSMPKPNCSSRSKAFGSAADGPNRFAKWPSLHGISRSMRTFLSWAIRSRKTAVSAR